MASKFPFFTWPVIWPHMSSCYVLSVKRGQIYIAPWHRDTKQFPCSGISLHHSSPQAPPPQPPNPSLCVVSPLAPCWCSFWHHTQQNHPKGPNRLSSGPWHHLVTWGKTFIHLPFVVFQSFFNTVFNLGHFCSPFLGLPAVFCAFLWLLRKRA